VVGLKRALAALAVAALIAGAIAIALVVSSDHEEEPALVLVFGLSVAWSFIGTGLYAWWRRPDNRFGALMTTVGFTSLIGVLTESNDPYVFTAGLTFGSVYLAVFVHMVLAYPDGRVPTQGQQRLVAGAYVASVVGMLPVVMLADREQIGCENCPDSVIKISDGGTLYTVFDVGLTTGVVALVAAVLVVLVRRRSAATPPQRRAMAPVLWSGVVLLDLLGASLIAGTIGIDPLSNVLSLLGTLAMLVLPWAYLFGLLRSRVSRAGAVSDVLLRIGESPGTGRLQDLLADALGDSSVELVYWLEGERRWVDCEGQPAGLPDEDDPARAATPVELEGRRVGAILHDRSLSDDQEGMRSLASAAALAVGHEHLQAQLRARVEQLRTSRARIVEAGTAERRRLERDLHDGAQQRLVSLSLTLRLAHARVETDPVAAQKLMAGAQEELTLALAELRELARGIHPAVLSDRGLDAALEALAERSPVPVSFTATPGEDRLPEAVEAAAYFVVAEALTNVVKYADASRATISVTRHNGTAVVEISDDGVGGADPQRGSGLRGLVDRVAALDGSLALKSEPGQGTHLRAEIPA
jgi:signal transduction histidine kinase